MPSREVQLGLDSWRPERNWREEDSTQGTLQTRGLLRGIIPGLQSWRERNTQTELKEMAVHKDQIHHTLQFTNVPTEPRERAVKFPL
ncbi:hypothetical protein AMELA_G00089740 [Ameiurus melas]|uniref:Uncharacterized protein n=1 Tax=Ameiurus melas TaxID=219545 RepID=A0A7J6AW46_AMEME|nr:hypothetical protein AMELA_G00089740 [Ameiurus melas]